MIENLECSQGFRQLNFQETFYKDKQGKIQPMYEMTRDGFMLLAMGFTGVKAPLRGRALRRGGEGAGHETSDP